MIIPSQGKTIVILGNGFDLDLGLDTSYSSFVSSETFRLGSVPSSVSGVGSAI